jgi:hypothetical protein
MVRGDETFAAAAGLISEGTPTEERAEQTVLKTRVMANSIMATRVFMGGLRIVF